MKISNELSFSLGNIPGLGTVGYKKLLEVIFKNTNLKQGLLEAGFRTEVISIIEGIINSIGGVPELPKLPREISIIWQNGSEYPELLRSTYDPPKWLYAQGNLDLLRAKAISIVGTREFSLLGKKETLRLVEFCREVGLVTVSGLARGIDTCVHEASLRLKVPTIAVLPKSLTQVYPRRNIALAREIVRQGGLLLSETAPSEQPEILTKFDFARRNRIIAGLSQVTAIMEAPVKSGALITADLTLRENRQIYVNLGDPGLSSFLGTQLLYERFKAQPLSITYSQLRQDLGFAPVVSQNSDLQEVASKLPKTKNYDWKSLSDFERKIITFINQGVIGISALLDVLQFEERSEFGTSSLNNTRLNVTLAKMQIAGIVKQDDYGKLSVA